ncbi:MAG: MFS transporter [Rhodospirillaceae bacterium]|nr:MFS transporter [Rhodospirillaceae bacterium]
MSGSRLSNLQTIAYGLPGLPLAVLLLPLFITVPTYYAEDLGLGFATVGLVLLFARAWDVLTDPLIGFLSDRTHTRFGRRRPWLLAGAPLMIVGAWTMFRPPDEVNALYLATATITLYLGGTMVMLPYTAWAAELSSDYYERSRIAGAREAALVIGTLGAMVVPALFGVDRALIMDGTAIALLIFVPLTVGAALMALPDPPVPRDTAVPPHIGLKSLCRNRPFRLLISAYFVNGIAYGLPATLFLVYAEHVLRRPDWSWTLLIIYFASAILALPVWLAVSRRIGKRRTWITAMIMATAGFWPAVLLGPDDLLWFIMICVWTGLPLGAELVMPPSMQAEVIDADTAKTGARRAGTLFGLWGVATKIPLALGVGIAFPILGLVGFNGNSGSNSSLSLLVLAMLYGLTPVAFKLLAIRLLWNYPLDTDGSLAVTDDRCT